MNGSHNNPWWNTFQPTWWPSQHQSQPFMTPHWHRLNQQFAACIVDWQPALDTCWNYQQCLGPGIALRKKKVIKESICIRKSIDIVTNNQTPTLISNTYNICTNTPAQNVHASYQHVEKHPWDDDVSLGCGDECMQYATPSLLLPKRVPAHTNSSTPAIP